MNWSMRQNLIAEAEKYAVMIRDHESENRLVEIVLLPSMGTIQQVSKVLSGSLIEFGAQNMAVIDQGELNGEFSIQSLVDMQGKFVELGHWERRKLYNETDEAINKKVKLALRYDVSPIVCIGEMEENEANNVIDEIKNPNYEKDLKSELFLRIFHSFYGVDCDKLDKIVIAYTPAWAVGKTKAASAPHISRVVSIIRDSLNELFKEKANAIRVVYGGTVSPENTRIMLNLADLDGVLLGRFGSKPERLHQAVEVVRQVRC
nr:triose-phosphate isomerase family protein [Enterococcus sp. 665A]